MRHISKVMAVAQGGNDSLNWVSLQGMTLDGGYVLEQFLSADERSCVFKARPNGDRDRPATVRIYRAGLRAAEEQIALWEAVRKLEHPNLQRILGSGRVTVEREELTYVAVEGPDETLAQVLSERPLSSDEAGELILSVCRGLEQLHAAGFVHGYLAPEEVLGVGDDIKLSTEGVRRTGSEPAISPGEPRYRAPENTGANVTAEADVWCLGATLFTAMTQKECGSDCRAEIENLPAPMNTIVHRCLYKNPEMRCTVAEVMQLYQRQQRAFAAAAGAGTGAGSSVMTSRAPARISVVAPPEVRPGPDRTETVAPDRRIWAYLAAAFLLVIVGAIWLAQSKRSAGPKPIAATKPATTSKSVTPAAQLPSASAPQPAQQRVAPVSQSPVTAAQWQPKTQPSHAVTAQANRERGSHQTHFVQGPIWRVVTYTYNSEADAERRAHSINGKHPDLKAEVFSPNGSAGPHLVVVGGQMSRETAQAMRQRVLRAGLPRDSYIQNYQR